MEKKKKEFTTERHIEERGSGREIPRVLLRVAVVVRDGRDFLVSDVAAIPPLRTGRKCAGASVGMTNERGRRVFAGFEVMECVALADGVARRPLEKQRQTQEKTRTLKNQGWATRKPERRQTQEKSLTPEGVSYRRRLAR